MSATLLVVEDEFAIREMLSFALEDAGFRLKQAATAEQAQAMLGNELPDLILLDWMLPGASGVEFARRVKRGEKTKDVPIILLTARGEEDDKIRGLDAGADDYIVKPFSPRELVARIKAVLRRSGATPVENSLELGGLAIDPISHRVSAKGATVKLGPTEYRLLLHFMQNADRVFTRNQLLDSVWGHQVIVEDRTVDVHIRRLRKALSEHGMEHLVQTVRGSGYRFSEKE
ncbi:MAG: phosphate regulon transcriptional regulator PhoB [Gammaproteobacteria bacterium]|nr:phosphate regulon transcriptional regulator PhoB [Gammaproteobacteria bacterium]